MANSFQNLTMVLSQDTPGYKETSDNYLSGYREQQREASKDSMGRLHDAIPVFKSFQDKKNRARNFNYDLDNY